MVNKSERLLPILTAQVDHSTQVFVTLFNFLGILIIFCHEISHLLHVSFSRLSCFSCFFSTFCIFAYFPHLGLLALSIDPGCLVPNFYRILCRTSLLLLFVFLPQTVRVAQGNLATTVFHITLTFFDFQQISVQLLCGILLFHRKTTKSVCEFSSNQTWLTNSSTRSLFILQRSCKLYSPISGLNSSFVPILEKYRIIFGYSKSNWS